MDEEKKNIEETEKAEESSTQSDNQNPRPDEKKDVNDEAKEEKKEPGKENEEKKTKKNIYDQYRYWGSDNNGPSGKNIKGGKKNRFALLILIVLLISFVTIFFSEQKASSSIESSYSTFISAVEGKKVLRATVTGDTTIEYVTMDGKSYTTRIPYADPDLVSKLIENGVDVIGKVQSTPWWYFAIQLLPWVIFFALMWTMMRSSGAMGGSKMMGGFGKSHAKEYDKKSNKVTFADVAGQKEAKYELQEVVDFLKHPDKFVKIGAKIPKGVLLVGPPGTGKTLLARAVAGEAGVSFLHTSGSDFVEMFVGMGASKVRDLFSQAKEKAPCIVFIDEIDAIGKKRDGSVFGGNDEREQTLNQLLTEMDGFESNNGVIILAATNRPDSLDPALTRPGRFDRRVPVELPDLEGREAILKVHAKKIKTSGDIDYLKIARMASGASGAELANIVNEAALRAVRDGRKEATQSDMEESIEVVIAGYEKKNNILTDHEKLIVSYHETGHALVAAMQTHSAPVQKITIVPRTSGALGYTMQIDEGNHYLMSKDEIMNKIATYTGGRAAEELIFNSITTGASNDIEMATKLARAMITQYGMSDEFGMVAMEVVQNQYLGGDTSLACSQSTEAEIDAEVRKIIKEQYKVAKDILSDNVAKLHEIAKYLYEHETITGEEFMKILGEKQIGVDESSK